MQSETVTLTEKNVSVAVYPIATLPPATYACTHNQTYWLCVSDDPIDVTVSVGTEYKINWVLTNADWAFDLPNKGIDIKPMRDWKMITKTARLYTAQNKKEGNRGYKYSITVKKDSTTLTWDPSIMN